MQAIVDYINVLKGPILVTGAAGFVGANLFKKLATQRSDVYAVVRDDKGWRLADVPDDQVFSADLTDANAVKHLLNSLEPKTVFDCVAYGAYSFEEQIELIYVTNFLSVVGMVEELWKRGVSAYIHAGSSSEYGLNCAGPKEDSLRAPDSHYSVSKSAVADYLNFVGKQRKFPCLNLRLYSVYGPLEDTSRLIPNLLSRALNASFPPFVDQRISRDFIHIDDVCDAFVVSAVRLHPELYGESVNIGTGVRTTIADLAAITKSIFEISEEPQFGSMEGRPWDLADWYANPARAEAALGWKASIGLADGLRRTSEWVKTLTDADMKLSTKNVAKTRKRSVTAIVACYKDGQAIPYMHRRLTATFAKLHVDYELIFVNDSSPDDSAKVIEELSSRDPRVIGIVHSRNFGSQMAFRSGMEIFTKEAVVLLDGDLQDPPELIEQFYAKWEQGWDVVFGRRVAREMPLPWAVMYKVFYRVFAAFSYIPIPRDAGDFSLMDRKVVAWLLNCPERDLFIRGLRAYVGFKQTGVDYVRPERMFGVSTNNLLKNIAWAKKGIFSFSDTPLNMLTALGVVLLGLSVLMAIIIAVLRVTIPNIAPRGITTVLISILFFGSLNLFAIGVVGEYVAKIMIEVKGRPRLIRAALIRNGKSADLQPDRRSA